MAGKISKSISRLARFFPHSHGLASLFGASGLRVVLYHHITDEPCHLADRLNVATSPGTFRSHLEFYQKEYDVVSLRRILEGDLPERPLLITFDDAYRSVFTAAGPLLNEFGFPSVFFINSGLVGNRIMMLDNLFCYLSHSVQIGELETAVTGRSPAVDRLEDLIRKVVPELAYERRVSIRSELVERFGVEERRLLKESDLYLHRKDLRRLKEFGIEIGNHTRNHVHCRNLEKVGMIEEIEKGKSELEDWSGSSVRGFSYPYGNTRDATPSVAEAVKRSGHRVSFLVRARTNSTLGKEEPLNRVSLQQQEVSELFTHLEVMPRLRMLADRFRGGDTSK